MQYRKHIVFTITFLGTLISALPAYTQESVEGGKSTFRAIDKLNVIDPVLIKMSESQEMLPVILILKDQLHRQEIKRIRQSYSDQQLSLSSELRAVVGEYKSRESFQKKEEELLSAEKSRQQLPSLIREQIKSINEEREALNAKSGAQIKKYIDAKVVPYQSEVERFVEKLGGKVINRMFIRNSIAAKVPGYALQKLASHPEIVEVVYDQPGEPELDNQVSSLGVSSFWNAGDDGGVWDVGVLDSGVEETHSALSSHTFYENYASNGYHGTGVACMYASTNSTYKGLAFGLNAVIVDNAGTASTSMAGADWMVMDAGDDPEAINYSWGNGSASTTSWGSMAKFVDAVVSDHNVVWAKSAGNSGYGTTTITQPGENYNGITVANMYDQNTVTRTDDVIRSTSSRGPTYDSRKKPDITAPGHNTYTCTTGDSWSNLGGTSSAAPKVGAASLLLRDSGHYHPMTMKAVMINTADSWDDNDTETTADDGAVTGKEWNKTYGWGYLDLWHAEFHKDDYFYTYVTPRNTATDYRFFKGQGYTGDKATMVWERDVDFNDASTPTSYRNLSDLNLRLYNETSNVLEDFDFDGNDNVHQVAATSSGAKVVKAYAWSTSFDGASSEYFALATEENFTAATGPVLSISSSAPLTVSSNQLFIVTATVNNTGDLKAHGTSVTLSLPLGFSFVSGSATQSLGGIEEGTSAVASWKVRAPFTRFSRFYTLSFSGSSSSYGETFSGSNSRSIRVNGISIILDPPFKKLP